MYVWNMQGGSLCRSFLGYNSCWLTWGIMSIPMASLLIPDILQSQPQECRLPYAKTPESPEPLLVSMVTHWEFRFLQVSSQVIPCTFKIVSVCGLLLPTQIPVKGTFHCSFHHLDFLLCNWRPDVIFVCEIYTYMSMLMKNWNIKDSILDVSTVKHEFTLIKPPMWFYIINTN